MEIYQEKNRRKKQRGKEEEHSLKKFHCLDDLAAAFKKHLEVYGGLDICINNAGIATPLVFHKDTTDGSGTWKRTINVNLTAVVDCTRIAIEIMRSRKMPGVIINMGSASGLYPMYADPIYSGTKGGVVLFTRALAPLKREGIRVNVLCPEFVQSEMAMMINRKVIDSVGGFLSMEEVVNGALELIKDESKAGACLWITKRRGMEYWPSKSEERKYLLNQYKSRRSQYTTSDIIVPDNFKKMVTNLQSPSPSISLDGDGGREEKAGEEFLQFSPKLLPLDLVVLAIWSPVSMTVLQLIVHTLDHNFRSATRVVQTHLKLPIKPENALVKIIFAGVNASDVNFSSGRYFGGNNNETTARLPFDAGFEAVGIIAAVGDSVHLKVGTPVAFMTFGGYAEFSVIPAKHLLPVPRPDAEVVAMLTSGLTASIALEKAGQMEYGKAVLVTAAAGGTGQFAVQLAKLAGNKVVATCGGAEKASLLRSLGADRVIDYKKENIKDVLKKEYPKGIDIIYESVGGEMFNICLNALAVYGRFIVIGMISQAGFFLIHYAHLWQEHLDKLFDLYSTGKLKVHSILLAHPLVLHYVAVDPKRFNGLDSVADAVEHLHSGKSFGKVVVCVDPQFSKTMAKL
ncbi:hypothetical protein ZIOFF_007942 [Zingiber officinale]|uniref:Enoyl reductase (ER) domain-containing protein n=1 Tax=Zingiber officinale TaxID=94328 RepID=A0A8J5IFJ0_ZINOF|nr:hypothetical protein ZIOFF_007942 [Zingiber officinale]